MKTILSLDNGSTGSMDSLATGTLDKAIVLPSATVGEFDRISSVVTYKTLMNLHTNSLETSMRAVVYREYGPPDVLQLEEIETPQPGEGQVLVRMHAASLNAADWHLMRGDPFLVRLVTGLRSPGLVRFGADGAGVVEAVGPGVTTFAPGDAVFGDFQSKPGGSCGEYALAKAENLAPKPPSLSFAEAAALPMAGQTALQAVRDRGQAKEGMKVAISGAGGGVGTFAVQIAKAFGAHVTAICGAHNAERVRSLGADVVLDYKQGDFTAQGVTYDLILAVNGYHPLRDYKRALAPRGRYLMVGGSNRQIFEAMLGGWLRSVGSDKRMSNVMAQTNGNDLRTLAAMVVDGQVRPVIDRSFPLAQTADALTYLEEGHARGKVVIEIAPA
jgi:NADPH:quinone reductase-like Zn-dependent oxidoreductase